MRKSVERLTKSSVLAQEDIFISGALLDACEIISDQKSSPETADSYSSEPAVEAIARRP